MERDCKREKRGKSWDEINMKSKEWDETVRDRKAAKETGARQKVSRKKNGAIAMKINTRQKKLGRDKRCQKYRVSM